jgi:2-keto-4-pentenoate hydratase/2-oxohepta-3-ene-1,7-dioic acid hydratase in catechol pathway
MKIICIGRNYQDHISELSNQRPKDPVVFIKPDSAVLPREQDFYIPDFSSDIHYEVEVLVKIKKVGKHISPEFAHLYFDEVGLGIDFTARDLQEELKLKGLPWEKCKGFDGSAVIGEWRDSKDLPQLNSIDFSLEKNGETVQQANTKEMLWSIEQLVSYVSTFFTLKKGDIIFTGTPAGVGAISAGDYLEGFLEGQSMFKIGVK